MNRSPKVILVREEGRLGSGWLYSPVIEREVRGREVREWLVVYAGDCKRSERGRETIKWLVKQGRYGKNGHRSR